MQILSKNVAQSKNTSVPFVRGGAIQMDRFQQQLEDQSRMLHKLENAQDMLSDLMSRKADSEVGERAAGDESEFAQLRELMGKTQTENRQLQKEVETLEDELSRVHEEACHRCEFFKCI